MVDMAEKKKKNSNKVKKQSTTKKTKKVTKQTKKKVVDKKRIIKKVIYIICIILLSIVFVLSLYNLIINNQDSQNSLPQDKVTEPSKPEATEYEKALSLFSEDIDLAAMRKEHKNDDIVARLEIPELFNILITKTDNNDYYLNHSINKKKDKKGTEFLDYRTNPEDAQVNVYGHNSRTYDIPFRKIESFLDEEFFNNNPYVLLQHDKATRIYKIISLKEVNENYEHMIVDVPVESRVEHIDNLIENSLYSRYVEYDKNSNILVIQTCSYNDDDTYYVITAIELNK